MIIIRSKFIVQKCTQRCRLRIFDVVNSTSLNRFVKVTIRDTQLLKLSVKSWQWSSLIQIFFAKKGSQTWFQVAVIVCFLSLTLPKTKTFCRYLRIFIYVSLNIRKLVIRSIVLFTHLLNKIVLNVKVFRLLAF